MEHMEQTAPVREKRGGKRVAPSAPHSRKPLIITGMVLAVLAAAYLGLCAYAAYGKAIWRDTHVLGQDIGGLTVEEASQKLDSVLPSLEVGVYLYDDALYDGDPSTLPERSGQPDAGISLSELGLQVDTRQLAQAAHDANTRERSFFTAGWRYLTYSGSDFMGVSQNNPALDAAKVEQFAQTTAETLSQAAVDSSFTLEGEELTVTVGTDGRTVDAGVLAEKLDQGYWTCELGVDVPYTVESARLLTAQEVHDEVAAEMKNAGYDPATKSITPEQVGAEFDVADAQRQLDNAEPGETVRIDAVIEYPAVTAEELKGVLFRDVLGTATTYVSGTGARVDNVRLASEACNGIVLNSGDVFSYNNTTGERTVDKGYGAASAYVNGLTVDTIGGGVCQPSSTLYLACLNANLEIVERYAHRYPPTYIAKGMDATVSWGTLDYKFRNDTDYPIKIVAAYSKGKLTMTLYGTKTDDITVKMTNKVLSSTPWTTVYEDDDTLPAGTEEEKVTPYTGYKVETYRNLYDGNGKLISSTFEASSDYKVRNQVIARGTGKAADVPASGGAEIPGGSTDPGTNTEPGTVTDPGTVTEPETPPVTEEPVVPVVVEPEPADPGSEVVNP